VARCRASEGAKAFAVVTLNEAFELRDAGIGGDVLVMGVADPRRAAEAAERGVTVAIHGLEHARACLDAVPHNEILRCHVKVDTGMHRLGAPLAQVIDIVALLTASGRTQLDGLMTHMSHADEESLDINDTQLAQFRQVIETLEGRGLCPRLVHAANSATIMRCPGGLFTAVRPGFALYGASPCPEYALPEGMAPIMTLRTAVALLRDVAVGEGVSYSHTWQAARPSRVAALPVGYADGYCRVFSNRAQVRIGGQLAPVVGNVCMDTTLVDVTDVPSVEVGTPVTLIEPRIDSSLSVHALGVLADALPHEIMTGIGRRVRRVYVDEE
jgi:alanine racemase